MLQGRVPTNSISGGFLGGIGSLSRGSFPWYLAPSHNGCVCFQVLRDLHAQPDPAHGRLMAELRDIPSPLHSVVGAYAYAPFRCPIISLVSYLTTDSRPAAFCARRSIFLASHPRQPALDLGCCHRLAATAFSAKLRRAATVVRDYVPRRAANS